MLRIKRKRLRQCEELRETLLAGIAHAFNATHIAKMGTLVALSSELFVPVLRFVVRLLVSI